MESYFASKSQTGCEFYNFYSHKKMLSIFNLENIFPNSDVLENIL